MSATEESVRRLPLELGRDRFVRLLLRELAGILQDTVGVERAAGFLSVVAQRIGDELNQSYCAALALSNLDREQVTQVLVDLKRRIQGDFFVIEESDEKIVLGNRACPFGDLVQGREALCMMTSNVMGVIAAENLGYARVVIEQAIAQGDRGCRIAIYLKPLDSLERPEGREYFKS